MDPNETLRRLREIAGRAERGESEPDDLETMGELFDALDDWLSRGGFHPADWAPQALRTCGTDFTW